MSSTCSFLMNGQPVRTSRMATRNAEDRAAVTAVVAGVPAPRRMNDAENGVDYINNQTGNAGCTGGLPCRCISTLTNETFYK
jgi:hypothetical protein